MFCKKVHHRELQHSRGNNSLTNSEYEAYLGGSLLIQGGVNNRKYDKRKLYHYIYNQ